MTAPIVHELTMAVLITGDEYFDAKFFTEHDITWRFLHDASCLQGDTAAVTVTEEPIPDASIVASNPASRLFRARALCPSPNTCSLLRKADR